MIAWAPTANGSTDHAWAPHPEWDRWYISLCGQTKPRRALGIDRHGKRRCKTCSRQREKEGKGSRW